MRPPSGDPSDDALMADPSAFRQLVMRYERPLLDYFRHNLLDEHRAEDLKQETLLKVHAQRDTYRPEGRFRSWLFRIAHSLLVNEWQRRGLRVERPLTDLPDEDPVPSDAVVRDETWRRVFDALRRLPPIYREALVMAYFDGMPYAEIAEATGTTVGNVAVRVHTALTFLREKLG